jgi:PPOX class probable F420-dependent enzyme
MSSDTLRAMSDLGDFTRISRADSGLCVITTTRDDASVQASVVNAGVLDHPVSGVPVVGLVARGGTVKLRHLRKRPRMTLVAKSGWEWVAVEGSVELFGPDDPFADLGAEELRLLLRAVFVAAGGTHDDWDEYDRVMVADRRTVVLINPERVYSNG